MSSPHPLFTVALTADERAHLVAAYRFMQHESEMHSALAALDAAKPARATKPRATPAAVEPFSPNTGDPAVDEFMRRHHDPKRKPLPLLKSPGLPTLRPMKVSEQDAAEKAWNRECNEARDRVIAEGKTSDTEATLRGLIAIHRNPWRLEATERPDSRTETRVFTSPRHPGVAIHEIRERGYFGSGKPSSTTWRVVADGELSEKVHYASQAAEREADAVLSTTLNH
ncbi:hypothetical protein ACKI1J_45675 [Streptomyces scabiei]